MIGVCIKYFHENYGGMLQAYATVKELERRGLDYELIRYDKHMTFVQKITSLPRLLNGVLINDKYEAFLKKVGEKKHPEFAKNNAIRRQKFSEFRDSHFVKLSPIFSGYKNLCDGAKRYSAVLTGSDQLWSPAGLPTNYYNLMFVPDGIRKISYASSFGVKNIPWYQRKRTAHFLRRMDFISMRENRGKEIVFELTGKVVPVILDPVFMFDKYGWEELINNNKEIQNPYIFAYFLGNNIEHRKAVTELSLKTGLKIVTLRHMDQFVEYDEQFGDIALYDVAPDRFLNLLRNADYVCTDSFHGTCFSIIHEKKFMVFNRYNENDKNSKNSRIDSLCQNLEIEDRRYNGNIGDIISEIDYDEIFRKLAILKNEADQYLTNAFSGIQ